MDSTYCVLYSEGNHDLDINLANITIAQICLLEKAHGSFYGVQTNIHSNCFANNTIKPDFDTCYEQQLLALSLDQQKKITDCKNDQKGLEKLIEKHSKNQLVTFTNYSPLIFINSKLFKGNFTNISRVTETVCGSYIKMPKFCKDGK